MPSLSPQDVPAQILNYNGREDVFEALGRISGYVPNIWLIENGSTVDRTDEVREMYLNVRIVETGENRGWPGGYNVAIDMAIAEGYRYVYLLNNDAFCTRVRLRTPSLLSRKRATSPPLAASS